MMNYAQVIEQTEQLKIGKIMPDTARFCEIYQFKNVIFIPNGYAYDRLGTVLEAILKEHKYSVGRFTAYALKNPTGRILYNKKPISQKEFAKYAEAVFQKETNPTEEELYLHIVFSYFVDKKVDFLILPKEDKELLTIIEEKCKTSSFTQRDELCGTIAADMLLEKGICLKENLKKKACEKIHLEGRFEVLKKKPYYIADGADDEMSVKLLMAKLQYFYPNNPYIFIVGVTRDNYEAFVKECAFMAQQIITITPPDIKTAIPAIELAQEFRKLNPNITNAGSVEEALEIASIIADKETVITAFGSTSFLERFRQLILVK